MAALANTVRKTADPGTSRNRLFQRAKNTINNSRPNGEPLSVDNLGDLLPAAAFSTSQHGRDHQATAEQDNKATTSNTPTHNVFAVSVLSGRSES